MKVSPLASVVAVATTAFALTGCSSTPTPTVTVTETVTQDASPDQSLASSATSSLDAAMLKSHEKNKVSYAKSANRAVIYDDYELAKVIVAQALEAGKFGEPYRYNAMKTEWLPGQTGWGGIAVNSGADSDMQQPGLFAGVYFNSDGSINFEKGITGLGVDAGPSHKGVLIFDEMLTTGPNTLPYSASLDQSKTERGKIWTSCISAGPTPTAYCQTPSKNFRHTSDVADMAQLDMAAKQALDHSMKALFDAGWRSLG